MNEPRPIWFGTERPDLFGMLHLPAMDRGPAALSGRGIVIAPPFGIEANSAHRPLRHLAELLTARGHVVLRYDHHGTGDSDGWDTDPHLVQRWIDGVGTAARLVRQETGVVTVTVIGLRLGATLAATWGATANRAPAETGVDQMVLWAPVTAGRTYVRELKALARMQKASVAASTDANDESALESVGFALEPETVRALSTLDLLKLGAAPAPHVLVAGRDDLQKDQPLVDAWTALGGEATLEVVPGYADLRLDDPERGTVPTVALSTIADWIGRRPVDGTTITPGSTDHALAVATSLVGATAPPRWATPEHPGHLVQERALRIGEGRRIFAIETAPVTALPDRPHPVVALLNTGSNPRSGPGRLHVGLARHLAAQGATVLRVDLSGIGDTPAATGGDEVAPYERFTVDDTVTVTQHLQAITTGETVLLGICSGAWAAYHAQLRDGSPTPDHVILLNQMIHDDASWAGDGETPAMAFKARHELGQAFRSLDKWKRLVRGELQLGPAVRRLGTWARLRLTATRRGRGADDDLSTVARQLRHISARGVTQLHVFDEPESGLAYLRLHADDLLDGPATPAGLELVTMSGTGHTFGPLAAQAELAALLTRRLCPAAAPVDPVPGALLG